MKKILAIALALVMLCSLSVVAFADDTVSMKLAVWTSNEDQLKLLGSFVDEFAAKKGISIDYEFESIPYADFTTKLLLELQGSDAPDVYWVTETSAPAFIAACCWACRPLRYCSTPLPTALKPIRSLSSTI